MNKIIVDVIVLNKADGDIIPVAIIGSDRKQYSIDKILERQKNKHATCGGQGEYYLVRVHGQERKLYHDKSFGYWFIDRT